VVAQAVTQPDEIIHQPVRLKIMAALKTLPPGKRLEFVRLKSIVGATEGNLGAHITTLENRGYVTVEKDFLGKRPRTRIGLTRAGRQAFESYVTYLRDIIDVDATPKP
jgi:DNA-binding MarR family transcriptional regulator